MILLGDCNHWLKEIKDNSIDLICTDPPYALTSKSYGEGKHKGGFMGKEWDSALVSVETWKECYRVLKDGKLAFIMSSPRQDVLSRMIINLEDAGFKTNYTSIYHTFASGFPKAKNNHDGSYVNFSPKPAVEVIIVVSKGKTKTWLDDCRIPYQSEDDTAEAKTRFTKFGYRHYCEDKGYDHIVNGKDEALGQTNEKGRFPANLLVSDDCLNDGKITKNFRPNCDGKNYRGINDGSRPDYGKYNDNHPFNAPHDSGSYSRYFSLDAWADKTFPFIITPKASRSERNKGCEDLPLKEKYSDFGLKNRVEDGEVTNPRTNRQAQQTTNHHPTVKPLKLMSYLITMGSREGDLVLDPFCGSGTVCIAADQLHRRWIGIEKNEEYAAIIKKRLMVPLSQLKLSVWENKKKDDSDGSQRIC